MSGAVEEGGLTFLPSYTTMNPIPSVRGHGIAEFLRKAELLRKGEIAVEASSTCCFTGHRPNKLPWGTWENDPRCQDLKVRLAQAIKQKYHEGIRHFICGMARGSDLYFAKEVLSLRRQYSDISLEAARPCPEQAHRWPALERQEYEEILKQCSQETLIQKHYDRFCMMRRNRYMVDHAAHLLAVYNGIPTGGTAQTLAYAMGKGRSIQILPLITPGEMESRGVSTEGRS